MPESLEDLVELLDLETIDVDLFRGRQPQTSLQRVFGGQVLGQALAAAGRTVDAGRLVHSLHAYFLRGGDTSVPIIYRTEGTRDGGSFSSRRVVASQHGKPIFYMSASFQQPEPGLDHQDPIPADVVPPDEAPTLASVLEARSGRAAADWDREWAALDVRLAGVTGRQFWIRASGKLPDDPLLHSCVLAYASDLTLLGASLLPHGIVIGDRRIQPASLDHALWFHRAFRADEWLLYDQASPSASGARGFSTGRLYSEDGRLAASVVQEGLIRPVDPELLK
ncbi:acyl-CoA thioesterase II [Kribbella sandramycini]|uniref:Acyl-CoA thioesterase 2 n=1 Tax=Kribbella sandramycini TaxID=60450 RepID=A0A7Y4KXX0_9ACTN|nr:acyl-CoA thioesterase II [Kribbella sandramycini]MBB6569471.1 acyl-CoA thioesterase-2 [Kribbella sandramycini]NOL40695.1 acyl-CoA thioesterase II [Kribbella sandramycini]